MISAHPDDDRLIALRLGETSGDESRVLLNHIAGCARCQLAAQETLNVRADAREVIDSFAGEESVDSQAGEAEETPIVRPARSGVRRWLALAAALAAIAIAALVLLQREQKAPPRDLAPRVVRPIEKPRVEPPPVPARPERWEALVRSTVAAGTLEAPAVLLSLQPAGDRFRSRTEDGGDVPEMSPFAEVIETDRPRFRWPRTAGAGYTVIVSERGKLVTQSPALTENGWRAGTALPRGRTYTWQVEIERGGERSMIPMPPAPAARFHVLDAESKAKLDEARRLTPADPLVLGILYAKAGLHEEAIEQLDEVSGEDAAAARRLRDDIRAWPGTRR
ncbi:MAG TPA: hypothetical protein VEK57_07110 [Thermoanaerobaculia bacterium]|nr:hypothetical protein [Thermoanaerobaculia bacterium]